MGTKMMAFRNVALVMAIAAVSACAKDSEDISATYVSPLQYNSFTCVQIEQEFARVSRRVSEVSGQQDKTAQSDAIATGVAIVLFWPAAFFIAGGDKSDELARLKGEYEALERAAIEKNCDISRQLEIARQERELKAAAEKAAAEARAKQSPGN
jgi:hypothetical protein